jgi:hypothetical protein
MIFKNTANTEGKEAKFTMTVQQNRIQIKHLDLFVFFLILL